MSFSIKTRDMITALTAFQIGREAMKTLVKKAKRGDADAFVSLIKQNKQSMYKVAKAILKSEDDAADAIQDTILVAWEHIGTLKKEEYFKTWLIRILINESNRIYRQRQSCISDEKIPEAAVFENGYQTVEWNIFFESIDEKYRLVLLLYYVEQFKVREIAELLQLSQSNVKKRLSEGRRQVQKKLEAAHVIRKEQLE